MNKFLLLATLSIVTTQVKADGLFMGADWSSGSSQTRSLPAIRDPQVRAEDTDGIRAHKLSVVSVQVYGKPYAGRTVPDGICDQLLPDAYDNDGFIAYKNSQAVHTLYKPGAVCEPVYYPGFAFWGGQPNMALAPRWNGQPDFVPSSFSYMDWIDPRYNPALR